MSAPDPEALDEQAPRAMQGRALSASLWGLLSAVLGLPVAVASTVALVRLLGPSDYGRYAVLGLTIPLVVGATDVGVASSLIQRGARSYGTRNRTDLKRTISEAFTWQLLRVPPSIGLAALLLHDATASLIYAVVILSALACAGTGLTLQSTLRLATLSRLSLLGSTANAIVSVLVAAAHANPEIVFASGAAAQSTALLLQVPVASDDRELLRASFAPVRLRRLRSDAGFGFITFISAQMITVMASRSELLFFRSAQSVGRGTYAGAYTVASRLTLPIDALFGALGASLSAVQGDPVTFDAAVRRVLRLCAALFSLSAGLGLWTSVAGASVAFPDSFVGVVPAAVVLSATSLLVSSVHPLISIYYAQRRARITLVASAAGLAVNLVASVVLIPSHGLSGAVIANCAGSLVYAGAVIAGMSDAHRRALSEYSVRVVVPLVLSLVWALPLALSQRTLIELSLACGVAVCQTLLIARFWPSLAASDREAILGASPMLRRGYLSRVARFVLGGGTRSASRP